MGIYNAQMYIAVQFYLVCCRKAFAIGKVEGRVANLRHVLLSLVYAIHHEPDFLPRSA